MKGWLRRLFRAAPEARLSCERVGARLQEYLDEHVDADLAAAIAAHLDDCRRCGLEADTYRRIKSSLASRRATVPEASLQRLREFGDQLVRGDGV